MSKERNNPIKVLFSFAGEEKGKMPLSVVLAITGELFGMLPYLSAAMLANEVYMGKANVENALLWGCIAAGGIVMRTLCCTISSARSHKVAFAILKNIRCSIAEKMGRVPMGVMLETPVGIHKTLMIDNVGRLEDSIAHVVPEAPSQIAAPLACMVLLFLLDYRMGFASLITIPLAIPFIIGMMRGYGKKMKEYIKAGNEMNGALTEYVGGIQVIKAFGRTGESFGKYARAVRYFHDSTMNWWKQCWFWMAAVKAIIPSTMLGTLPIGVWLYMQKSISLPILIACLVLPIGFITPFMKLAFGSEQLTTIAANLRPIEDFFSIQEQKRPEQNVNLNGEAFSFRNVSFAYCMKQEVLHDVSFDIAPGTMTAIVGPSGSGKSTIAKLLAGFWDATKGEVIYGGCNICRMPFRQLMNEVSYVAQDNFLFNKSIRENIRMGDPQATDEEVEEAAKAANCHEFIMQLPAGYETGAGDAGERLSGGERQRITIARAMLKQASVVILDEATAYADPESEAQIQEAVGKLVHGKTLVVVAHRLSTIQHASQILVVDGGEIIARGTHEELLKNCSLYKKMWEQHIDSANDSKVTERKGEE